MALLRTRGSTNATLDRLDCFCEALSPALERIWKAVSGGYNVMYEDTKVTCKYLV